MRSNDIMRGLPYNFIQFTMLQEVMAGWLECDLGEYFHLADSLHIYERDAGIFCAHPTGYEVTDRRPYSLSYDETRELFSEIYEDLSVVAGGKLNESELRQIFDRESATNKTRCELVGNIMVVVVSDAARRYGLGKLARELAESCTEVSLRTAALAWLHHKEGSR